MEETDRNHILLKVSSLIILLIVIYLFLLIYNLIREDERIDKMVYKSKRLRFVLVLSMIFLSISFFSGLDKVYASSYFVRKYAVESSENSVIDSANKNSVVNEKKGLTKLKKKILKELKGSKGSWSVYVKNLDTNEYMLINNKKLPSASLIKLYVMMTAYDEVKKGNIKENTLFNSRMKSMITVSDNDATNALTRSFTKKKTFNAGASMVNKYCKKNGYSKTRFLVEMGKSSPKNVTCTRDCGLALERMYRKTAVNKASSKKMIKYLKAQTRRGKIPAGVPKTVTVANKTGETSFAENDAAIVYSKGADYVIVVMSKNGSGSIKEIQKISKMVYNYFN